MKIISTIPALTSFTRPDGGVELLDFTTPVEVSDKRAAALLAACSTLKVYAPPVVEPLTKSLRKKPEVVDG